MEKRAKEGGSPTIVIVTSLGGFETRSYAVGAPYATFKRAQATIAKDYARKLAPLGIRINTVVLGLIENPNITLPDGTVQWSNYQLMKKDNEEAINAYAASVPMGRPGTPEEVANAVLFLSSRLSSYVCGANLVVDGSLSLFS